jgi:hypothetical protein
MEADLEMKAVSSLHVHSTHTEPLIMYVEFSNLSGSRIRIKWVTPLIRKTQVYPDSQI